MRPTAPSTVVRATGARAGRLAAGLLVLALLAAGCGGGGDDGVLNFYVLNEPSGSFEAAAEDCSTDGARIEVQLLPADADQQREQLVRRLAAGDTSIDLIGMDVIWTAEFAEAEWILPFEGEDADAATEDRLEAAVQTATYQDQVWGAPFTSNTQLLWYRSDLVEEPPETWEGLFETSEELAESDEPSALQGQGNRYEGLTVFFNTLLASAGGQVLSEDGTEVSLEEEPTRRALDIMRTYATGPAAPEALSTSLEDSARLAFEEGSGAYMVNYPFVWPSAEQNAPEIFESLEYVEFPRVGEDPARVTIGGITVGVGAFTGDEDAAFEAATCLASEENQKRAAIDGGLPPTRTPLYEDPELEDPYPFADVLLSALEDAAIRPQTPRYNDVSLAIAGTLHPMSEIDDDTYDQLVENVERALAGEGLL